MIRSISSRLRTLTLAPLTLLLLTSAPQAGDLDAPAAPSEAGSAMYTLDDIYQRLDKGTEATKRAGAFEEPSAGPTTGTMHDLNAIMELINTRAPVAKTGQTACYDPAGNPVNCAGTGQDGELQKGVTWPTPRFTINVNAGQDDGTGGGMANNGICDGAEICNGTVTDNLTGLIWLTKANCIGTDNSSFDNDDTGGDGRVTWQHALDFVAGINNGTYACADISNSGSYQTDWRLPNIKELQSLADYAYYDPALSNTAGTEKWTEGSPFSGVQASFYWSSSTLANIPGNACLLGLDGGGLSGTVKTHYYFVWPVRGGQ